MPPSARPEQQLSPQDAVFLSMETDEMPAQIGGLSILEPCEGRVFDYETFVAFARERLAPCERFSWRLQEVPFGLDRAWWVRTPDFDPADHIHRIALPRPYSDEALARLAGWLFEQPLDRSRPLWEMTLIEGLPGGRFALLWKIHHCLMDGASGAGLSEQLFDPSPYAVREAPVQMVDEAYAGEPLRTPELMRQAARNALRVQRAQAGLAAKALRGLVAGTRKEDTRESRDDRRDGDGGASQDPEAASLAPRIFFNGEVGRHRGIAWSSVSLEEVKRLKNALSVTVNDVVLALTAGALRDYLDARGALPEASLIASVPCSVRSADDKSLGNQVRDMAVRWSTDVEDPIERVLRIHRDATRAKQAARQSDGLDMMSVLSQALVPGALKLLMRGAAAAAPAMPLPANAVVSNVPMTPFPLYCAGAKISKALPISMLAPTQGFNITVLSYCGELHFGLVHDPDLLPDPWELTGRIAKQLQVLQEAVDQRLQADPDGTESGS